MNTGLAILSASLAIAVILLVWRSSYRAAAHSRTLANKDAENNAALRSYREERDKLLDALSDALLLVDGSSTIIFANQAAHRLFGSRTLVQRRAREIFLDPRLSHAVFTCLESAEPVTEHVIFSQQASPLGCSETRGANAWIIDAAPLPSSAITRIVIRDVTTEHQTEQIRKDFVANASHELRTPMAIISGYLENLLDEDMLEDPAITRRFLTVMRKHAERISRIIEDMLVISRLESGDAVALKPEPFRIHSCVNDVIERLESIVQLQNAKICVAIEDPEASLEGDRFYWTQVLFNLVENALKQNPHPGLTVKITCRSEGEDKFRITVEDDGVGIPSADLPHIFRRFYRVEKHHSQKEIKGTGLGLSIVKRAVAAHHGTITVDSIPGRETRFTIIVPRNFPTAPAPAVENAE